VVCSCPENLWCLTPLSTIFHLYRGGNFYWWRKPGYPEKSLSVMMDWSNKRNVNSYFLAGRSMTWFPVSTKKMHSTYMERWKLTIMYYTVIFFLNNTSWISHSSIYIGYYYTSCKSCLGLLTCFQNRITVNISFITSEYRLKKKWSISVTIFSWHYNHRLVVCSCPENLWCLTPLSTIFHLYRGGNFYWWRKPGYPEKRL
jgi:hypothetical protein